MGKYFLKYDSLVVDNDDIGITTYISEWKSKVLSDESIKYLIAPNDNKILSPSEGKV